MTLNDLERALLNLDGQDAATDPAGRGRVPFNARARLLGLDRPVQALATGLVRLRRLRTALEHLQRAGVAGDVADVAVERGGTSIYLQAVLQAQRSDRHLWIVDRNHGLQTRWRPDDTRVHFLSDTTCPIERLALLRLGPQSYQATLESLVQLYDKLSPGGYVVVDGYGRWPGCRQAVDDFRRRAWIQARLSDIDGTAVCWQTPGPDVDGPQAQPLAPPRRLAPQPISGPLVTVIIPIHNRIDYLPECLGSVLKQDPGPDVMEIMVCDDGSATDVESEVRALAGPRARYVRRPTNVGQWPNVNLALAEARGRWIHLLHDDDFVLDGFYRTMLAAAERVPVTAGVLYCHHQCQMQQDPPWLWEPLRLRNEPGVLSNWLEYITLDCPVNLVAVLVRRQVYETQGVYDEHGACADWEFHIRSATAWDWWYEPQDLARYRVHPDSVASVRRANGLSANDLRLVYEAAARYLPEAVARRVLPRARAKGADHMLRQAVMAFEGGSLDVAVKLVGEALLLQPRWA